MALSEFVRNGLSMIFLLNRRYMPYYKWAFRASRELPVLSDAAGKLESLLAGGGNRESSLEMIEAVSGQIIGELKKQGLTGGSWDYLEPHGLEIMERIKDGKIRNLHLMEGE